MQNRVASATLNEVQIQQVAVSIEFRDEPVIVGHAGFPIGIGDEIAFARRMGDKGLGALELADGIGKGRQRPGTQQQNHGDGAERRPEQARLPGEKGGETYKNGLQGGRVSHSGMLRHPLGGVKAVDHHHLCTSLVIEDQPD